MQDCSTARFAPVFRRTWLALWLVLGCGEAGTETEMAGDTVMGAGPASAAGAGGPATVGSAGASASAAVSGGRAGSGVRSVAAAGSGSGGSQVGGAGSAGGASNAGPSTAGSPNSAGGPNSAGNAGGANSAGSTGTAGSANTAGGPNSAGEPNNAGSTSGANSAAAGAGPSTGAAGASASGAMQAGAAGSGMATSSDAPLTVYIASDSTASNYKDTGSDKDQAGWGQMLPELVKPNAKVDNRAIGGRTARRFIDEGSLDKIWSDIKAGDYLLVQFGTNDGNKTATYELNGQQIPYYLDPATDFKTYIKKYIAGAHEHGAVPVLVTPPPRNSAYCTGGNGTGAHAQALRELGESEQVLVVDLNQKTVDYLKAICPEPSPPDFFLQKPDGSVDGTHFQERGARKLASFVAEGLRAHMVAWVKD